MKRIVSSLVLVVLLGCSGFRMSSDIAVVDMVSGEICHPPNGKMRQVVVSVDPKTQTFFTMVKKDALFRMTQFDSSCHKVSECTIPVFTSGYCGSTGYALSRDSGRLVYLKDNTRNLYLFDIAAQKETPLWEGMANSWMEIPRLAWVSGSNIVAVLRKYPGSDRRTNAVIVLDIPSGERRTIYEPTDPADFDYSLSPDGSLLAFEDANKPYDIHGVIKILDIRNGTVRATLGSGRGLIGSPCWNPEGTELVYVDGQELKIWRIADNATRTLRAFPDQFICYHVVFGTGMVGYVGGKGGSGSINNPLVILDSRDGKKLRTIRAPFNGGMFLLSGNKVVCEIGY